MTLVRLKNDCTVHTRQAKAGEIVQIDDQIAALLVSLGEAENLTPDELAEARRRHGLIVTPSGVRYR